MDTAADPRQRLMGISLCGRHNLGDRPAAAMVMNKEMVGHVVVSAFCDREGEVIDGTIDLRPNEGLIVQLS
jgi:hypothetical protein